MDVNIAASLQLVSAHKLGGIGWTCLLSQISTSLFNLCCILL